MKGFNWLKSGKETSGLPEVKIDDYKGMKTAILFKTDNETVFIKNIDIVASGSGTDLMIFSYRRWKYVAIKTTNSFIFNGHNTYWINQHDQNTFDPETLEILSENYKESFVKYLEKNPERMVKTKTLKPDKLDAHDISQDVLIALLDEHTWLNLLKGAMKGMGASGWLYFVAGVSVGILILFLGGILAPDTVSIMIGGVGNGGA